MAEVEQPIIIKKITIEEGGHHGGAWKVAYADFVTAMMAFFLLLWLLSSASDAQLQGIADYFSPTFGLKDSMGIGFEGGQTDNMEDGTRRNDKSAPGIVTGQMPQGIKPGKPQRRSVVESPEGEQMLFEQTASSISQITAQDKTLSDLGDNIMVEQTPEGLKIQIMDTDGRPMFHPGHTALTEAGQRIVARITEIIRGLPNHISITGHTDASAFRKRRNYSNWELSTERANSARRYMIRQGMLEERVAKVQGRADKELLLPNTPTHPKNRRIEILLLRGSHMVIPHMDRPAVHGVLPNSERRQEALEFEDKKSEETQEESLEQKEVEEENFSPVTIIPEVPLQNESVDSESIIEFVPN